MHRQPKTKLTDKIYEIEKLVHSRGDGQQNAKLTNRVGENICKVCT